MKTVKFKKEAHIKTDCCGDFCGVQTIVYVNPMQKWQASKFGKYWCLTRKGVVGYGLRMTEAAMKRLTEEVER